MTADEREIYDRSRSEWNQKFEQAKKETDGNLLLELVRNTDDVYCICKIIEHLEQQAKLENSNDAIEHWHGFLARTNIAVCKDRIQRISVQIQERFEKATDFLQRRTKHE
jgi:hypothetical protein